MTTEFGKAMRSIREERGMTLEEMAAFLGTTKQALSRYERGERTPKITVAARFAEALNVPLEALIGYEYHEEDPEMVFAREDEPKNDDVRLLIRGLNKLSPEQLEQATNVMRAMFTQYADYFNKENDDDT